MIKTNEVNFKKVLGSVLYSNQNVSLPSGVIKAKFAASLEVDLVQGFPILTGKYIDFENELASFIETMECSFIVKNYNNVFRELETGITTSNISFVHEGINYADFSGVTFVRIGDSLNMAVAVPAVNVWNQLPITMIHAALLLHKAAKDLELNAGKIKFNIALAFLEFDERKVSMQYIRHAKTFAPPVLDTRGLKFELIGYAYDIKTRKVK